MRVLMIIDSLGSGGAQRQMVTLSLGLQARGHTVNFFVYQPEYEHFLPDLQAAGISVFVEQKTSRYSLKPIFALRRCILQEHYDIVLSFLDTPNLYAELAVLGLSRQKLVVSERSTYRNRNRQPSRIKFVLEQFHRLADRIVVNSYFQADCMLAVHPWLSNRLDVIYNGIDLNKFSTQENAPKNSRLLLCVGSIIPVKNSIGVAKSLAVYRDLYGEPPVIHWVGEIYPTSISQETYRNTQQFLETNHLESYWQWRWVQNNLSDLYLQYPALLHASFFEGLSNVIGEAMACGLPILAGRICEHPRLVQEGVNGFLFDPDDPNEMAQAMYQFFSLTKSEQINMGRVSRKMAEEMFSLETLIDRYEMLFLSLCPNKNS